MLGKDSGLKEYWDDTAKAPYLYSEVTGQLFTYDNVKSISYKTQYVKENELGGVISCLQAHPATSFWTPEVASLWEKIS